MKITPNFSCHNFANEKLFLKVSIKVYISIFILFFMIEYFIKSKNQDKIEKVPDFASGCWVNVFNPSTKEIDFLVKKFSINKANLIDGLDIHENPRFEIENNETYIYLTTPTSKIEQEYDSSFLVIYSKTNFITVSKYPLEIFEKILDVKRKFKNFSHSRNLLKILFFISGSFEKSTHRIIKKIKANRTNLSKLKNKDIEMLIGDEDKLNYYISSFGATIQNYNKILRDKSLKFMKKDQEIIEDLIIDLNETLNLCKQTLKTISNMRNYYSTKLSNDLNKTVTVLTIFTIFLSIPTLIASIYGMNVNLPFQTNLSLLPFLGMLVVGIWVLMFSILKRYKMI
jgi:magnesium transporter